MGAYSQKSEMATVTTIRGIYGALQLTWLCCKRRSRGPLLAGLMVRIQVHCQREMFDSRWWSELGNIFMHIATFRPFQWIRPGASEDILSSKLLMCQPPAKSDNVQYNAWPVLVKHRGWRCAAWSPCLLSNLVSAVCSPTVFLPAAVAPRNKCVLRNGDT